MCPAKQTTEPNLVILVSFCSGEVTSYTDTIYCIHILWEVCRSIISGPPCIRTEHYYYENLSFERVYPTLWNMNGVSFLTFNYFWTLSFEKNHQHFLPPAMPLSCSCQTPRVINPSIMRTTAVVSASCYATILLMPDSEGHKPKHNENNRCGFCLLLCHYLARIRLWGS